MHPVVACLAAQGSPVLSPTKWEALGPTWDTGNICRALSVPFVFLLLPNHQEAYSRTDSDVDHLDHSLPIKMYVLLLILSDLLDFSNPDAGKD